MSKRCCIPRVFLGALGVVLVGMAVQAQASDCTTSLADPNCFHLKGSDTLHDIMVTSINNARAAGIAGANNLQYDGSGSGNAESQMVYNACKAGLTCTPVSPATVPLGVQSIGPMSRNFRPSTIDAASVGFAAATGTDASKKGHAAWAPGVQNVLGLDASVWIIKGTSSFKNLNFPTFVDNAISTDATTRAVTNNKALPTNFGDGSAFNNTAATDNYSNLLMVILGGVDGSGTLAACSDPRRVQAVQDLALAIGANTIDHVYRRDDNSGTTSTWQDRIITIASTKDPRYPWIGGLFCNGQSIGNINGSTAQTGICSVTRTNTTCKVNTDCPSGEVCQFNLNNFDLDPIRRPCVAADSTHAPTSCTDMTTGKPCQATDGNPNCTQGLVVAITDFDPGSTDETTSIAARIKNDPSGQSVGYAGKEAVLPGKGTKGLTINTTGFTDTNVRKNAYLMSRRLFLQNASTTADGSGDVPSDTAGVNIASGGQGGGADAGQGGGSTQFSAEQNLWSYMTDPNGTLTGGSPGRCQTDPVVSSFFFIPCWTDCTVDVSTLSNNLCAKYPASPVASGLSNIVPNGALGGPSGTLGAQSINSQGAVWNGTSVAAPTCTSGQVCAGSAYGTTCPGSGTCPLFTGRPQFSACSVDSDCATGLHCTDYFGFSVQGAYLLCN